MKPDMFEKPVMILLGLGIPTEVKSVMQAYQILMDWRNAADPSRELALKACKAAINGEIEAQTARAVFVAFAERHDLLAPEMGNLVANATSAIATRMFDE
jgi:predicted AAA+ superfamily ATPase